MAAIAKLIRNAPRDLLEAFFDAQECPLGELLRSFGPDDDYAGPCSRRSMSSATKSTRGSPPTPTGWSA
jgi:hypothetical protein